MQDTTASAAHQGSAGGGISISAAGGSASVSAQNGHGDATYAQVGEQAGINAGDGGFDITVKGNTNLTGAVISSTADESLNSLSTGTLTFSDIQNQSHYSATSAGVSMGVGVASTGKATGPGSVSNTGGIVPMIVQNENGDQRATTRSAVSAGTITVTNQAAQTQDVATLSRDTTGTNGMVSKTPDVNAILNQQADTMQAAQAAGQVVAQGIGAYADMKRDQALNTAQTAYDWGDLDAANAALADYSNWKEGGDSRALMQGAGGALVGGLGGGGLGAVGGAAGAGLSSKLADQAKAIRDAVSDSSDSTLLGNIAVNIVSGLGGALVGGSAGAAGAANVNLYNQGYDTGDVAAEEKAASLTRQIADAYSYLQQLRQSVTDAVSSTVDGVVGQIKANNGQNPPADPNPLVQADDSGNTPSGTAGAVITPPAVVCTPNIGCAVTPALATPGTPGYVPQTATLSSNSSESANSNATNGGSNANGGSLSGSPTQIPPLSDAVTARSLVLENQSAITLANNGYDVVQNPRVLGPKNPDYLINGMIFDNYAPSTGNVRNIASTISDKVSSGQASNIVVNLTDSNATAATLQNQLRNYPIQGLNQVIVIDKSGAVIRLTIKAN